MGDREGHLTKSHRRVLGTAMAMAPGGARGWCSSTIRSIPGSECSRTRPPDPGAAAILPGIGWIAGGFIEGVIGALREPDAVAQVRDRMKTLIDKVG